MDNSNSPFKMVQDAPAEQGCGCSDGNCLPSSEVTRRDFLKLSGAAGASLLFPLGSGNAAQSQAAGQVRTSPHLIPADKQLSAGWLKSLWEQGEKTWWSGQELRTIGMPVCGIGTGQLYLCGDGALGQWEIFNQHEFIGHGPRNYAARRIKKPVEHGFGVWTGDADKPNLHLLNETGFTDVRFRGEYPIGTVTYTDEDTPVAVTLEAFSPFIPLNAPDSALPATILTLTIRNVSRQPVNTGVLSWLENPIARTAGERGWPGKRMTRVASADGLTRVEHAAEHVPQETPASERQPIVFADFESGTFGDWKATGTAFASAPAPKTQRLPKQQQIEGVQGEYFINSFHGGDDPTGKLLSPEFTVTRRFINFLLAGGNKTDLVGMRLLVNGEGVRKATGRENEHLRWQHWDVSEYEGQTARLELFDEATGGWGHVLADQIEFADKSRSEEDYEKLEQFPDFGTMTYGTTAKVQASVPEELTGQLPTDVRERIAAIAGNLTARYATPLATEAVSLQPGEETTFSFVLTWHFPNTIRPREAGHEYAARFDNSSAVADYIFRNWDRLTADTRKWRDTWYDSTLPYWLLDRVMLTADCLATGTSQLWKNGRFWAWEGVVCCEGTCTHVWNYAQSLAFLFPQLERSVREQQDLGVGLEPSGLVGFRHNGAYAADGQAGTVLKVWREHRLSADDQFLRRNWPDTRKVIDFLLQQDANADGLIENGQHNTYDIDFYGANTFVGALYLGALRAGEEMAREVGELDYADKLRAVYESGRRASEERLWNGEYFIQQVDLQKHPQHQYGPGCLSDQMFGQNWAHITGLGYLYDAPKVKSALQSVWKYNWAPETGKYNERFPPERPYTDATEAGLFICTWPNSQHLDEGVRYRDEVWTGIEYQVAAHMMMEGLVEEGLAICRAVHDRYHPARRNPYNEVECSDFYARAMASWGVLLALSGYQHHGPKGYLAFAPRYKPEDFRCAFTTCEGWGTFTQKVAGDSTEWSLELRHGQLSLSQLDLTAPAPLAGPVRVEVDGRATPATQGQRKGNTLLTNFTEPLMLKAGARLRVRVGDAVS